MLSLEILREGDVLSEHKGVTVVQKQFLPVDYRSVQGFEARDRDGDVISRLALYKPEGFSIQDDGVICIEGLVLAHMDGGLGDGYYYGRRTEEGDFVPVPLHLGRKINPSEGETNT